MSSMKESKCNMFTYIVIVDLDVFASSMEHRINGHIKHTEIVTQQQ